MLSKEKITNLYLFIGKLEGYSYLILLFIAMPLKYLLNMPLPVRIVGSAHGFLFMAFLIILVLMINVVKFSLKNATIAFVMTLIPFGSFYLNRLLNQKS